MVWGRDHLNLTTEIELVMNLRVAKAMLDDVERVCILFSSLAH
jgi:hypothetical protein